MTESPNRRVHVIEDDVSMRVALKRLLRCSGYSVKEYASAGEFLVSDTAQWTGCLLLDVELGGPNGLELQQALLRLARPLPVVFMSAYSDIPKTVRAMKAGAVDFLVKPFERQALFVSLDAALRKADPTNDPPVRFSVDSLARREKLVLRGVLAGQRNKQIAAELGLSERTIKGCRAGLMRKFEARSLAELLRRAEGIMLAA